MSVLKLQAHPQSPDRQVLSDNAFDLAIGALHPQGHRHRNITPVPPEPAV